MEHRSSDLDWIGDVLSDIIIFLRTNGFSSTEDVLAVFRHYIDAMKPDDGRKNRSSKSELFSRLVLRGLTSTDGLSSATEVGALERSG